MVTTLIKRESDIKISLNPIELGHSSYYQEFKCKLYNPNSGLKNLYFTDTHSQPFYLLLDDLRPFIEEGDYYPYIIFDINGNVERILIYKVGRKPVGYNYYTRINFIISIDSNLKFIDFDDTIIKNNFNLTQLLSEESIENVYYSGDVDLIDTGGFYYCNVGSSNIPSPETEGFLIAHHVSPSTQRQIFTPHNSNKMYLRVKESNVWGSWVKITQEDSDYFFVNLPDSSLTNLEIITLSSGEHASYNYKITVSGNEGIYQAKLNGIAHYDGTTVESDYSVDGLMFTSNLGLTPNPQFVGSSDSSGNAYLQIRAADHPGSGVYTVHVKKETVFENF